MYEPPLLLQRPGEHDFRKIEEEEQSLPSQAGDSFQELTFEHNCVKRLETHLGEWRESGKLHGKN